MDRKQPRKPRFLIVTRDRYPPFRVDLTELFSRWLTPRFDIDWVMQGDADGSDIAVVGRPGERFLVSRCSALAWLTLQCRESFRVARGEVELVQVRDAALSATMFYLASRIGHRPFVFWMSYPIAEGYRHRALHQTPRGAPWLRLVRSAYGWLAAALFYGLILPRASHVFVQSERMKADVAAKGVPPGRITAVPMGVSIAIHHPGVIAPTPDERLEGRKVLVYVGSLDPEREIEMLVEALGRLVIAGIDAVLVIVGHASGKDGHRLNHCARKLGVTNRLVFTGHLPLNKAFGYMRRADICLSPFPTWPALYLSATPTKLVEYLAMGRPVVASDHPDQRAVIEHSGAGVIAPATAEGFAAAIANLLANPAKAEAMGAKGTEWVAKNRDYAVISQIVAQVYDCLLDRSGR